MVVHSREIVVDHAAGNVRQSTESRKAKGDVDQ
jgi:hypothetical protein